MDYLSRGAFEALRGVAEAVLGSAADLNAIADDDMGPLALTDGELSAMTAKDIVDARASGDVWEDDGVLYLCVDAFPKLVGQRVCVAIDGGDLAYSGDTVMFEWDGVRHHGWVTSIDADGSLAIHHDDGTDWTVGPSDIVMAGR